MPRSTGLGWSVEVTEVSPGVFRAVASDREGSRIDKTGTDPEALERACRTEAADISKRKLEAAIDAFTSEPPPRVDSGAADDIRADLIAFDTHATGVASSVVGGVEVPSKWFAPDSSFRERIAALEDEGGDSNRKDAAALRRYLAQIEELVERAKVVAGHQGLLGSGR
jgi:hypothetical protein